MQNRFVRHLNLHWSYEPIYRFILWLFIGVMFSFIYLDNLGYQSLIEEGMKYGDTKVKEWNDKGVLGLCIFVFVFFIHNVKLHSKGKYKNSLEYLSHALSKVASDIILPVFCIGASILGTISYITIKAAADKNEIYFVAFLGFQFLIVLAVLWAGVHILKPNEPTMFDKYLEKLPLKYCFVVYPVVYLVMFASVLFT